MCSYLGKKGKKCLLKPPPPTPTSHAPTPGPRQKDQMTRCQMCGFLGWTPP